MSGASGIVVVGGGVAGFSTCAELRHRGFGGAITLLDEGDLVHDRPPLSKDYLLGRADDATISLADPAWFAANDIDLRTGVRAVRLHTQPPAVTCADGAVVAGEAVVLALGGEARALSVPGGDSPAVHVLRRVGDARRLREVLQPGARVLVVGGGLIGAEVASTAVARGATVTLVDPVDPPLAGVVGPRIARRLHDEHRRHGIEVLTTAVERLADRGGAVRAFLRGGHRPVEADIVVAGLGMVPTTGLASAAGLAVDGGVLVDDRQRTSAPGVYAVGDCSRRTGPDGRPLPTGEHWEAAQRAGQAAAAAILGQAPPPPSAPWFWTDRHGEHIEVIGSYVAGTSTVLRGNLAAGPFLAFALDRRGVVVGAVAVDQPRAARVARRLVDKGLPVDATLLGDPGTDLRRLLTL